MKRRECQNCFTGYELQAIYVRESDPNEPERRGSVWGSGRRKQKWKRIGTTCGYCGSVFFDSEREAERERKIKDFSTWKKNGPPAPVIETRNYS